MKKYYSGAKPYLEWEVRNRAGALVNPTTGVTCAIYDPTNTMVSATATETCTNDTTGVYYYQGWAITSSHITGVYKAIATVTDGTSITRDDNCVIYFEVTEVGGH